MKPTAAAALMLTLGLTSAFAHQRSVTMTFSGSSIPSTINLQPSDSTTGEDDFAGSGTLGQFTVRIISAETIVPTPSSSCAGPNLIHSSRVAGAAVFRFDDGSLLTVNLTSGDDCIDLQAQQAHCVVNFQIAGGTGRFNGATGRLILSETVVPVLSDSSANPVFFSSTGGIVGTITLAGNGDNGNQ